MPVKTFGCKSYRDGTGILLGQLGTPDAPTKEALRPYLKEFLSDRRVIEANRFVWWLVLNGIILRTRPKRSAALYKRIWRADGSPLMYFSLRQRDLLKSEFTKYGIDVAVGMRYGSMPISESIDALINSGCSRILFFPMYPQYSAATTGSTYDAVFSHLSTKRWVPTLRVVEPYFRHPAYISAQSKIINEYLSALPRAPERLLISYHGVPASYIKKGDPYCCMCTETTELLKPHIKFPKEAIIQTYQSRFGKDPWLTPYADETIANLGKQGIKRIAIAAPAFTADCLETLDELGNEGSHLFKENGGEELTLFPCLNDHPAWIDAMKQIIESELGSWLQRDSAPASLRVCPAGL